MATTDPLSGYTFGRRPLAIITIGAGAAVALFRIGGGIWPLYLLAALATLGLYAVVFTRGEALAQIAVLVGLTAALWGLWELTGWAENQPRFETWPIVQTASDFVAWATDRLEFVALLVWVGAILWSLSLALGRVESGAQATAVYFLTIGSFVFGLWGTFSVLIEMDALSGPPFALSLLLTIGLPLLLLTILLFRATPDQSGAALIALIMLIASSYVVSIEFLFELVDRWLGVFLPDLLNRTATVGSIEPDWFDRISDSRKYVSLAMTALSFGSLFGLSAVQAVARARAMPNPRWYERTQHSLQGMTTPLMQPFVLVFWALLKLELAAYTVVLFVFWTLTLFAKNTYATVREAARYVLYVLVPIVAFSVVSVVMIIVLQALAAYRLADNPAPRQIWSESLTVMIVSFVLTIIAVGFSPGGFGGITATAYQLFSLTFLAFLGLSLAITCLTGVLYFAVKSLDGNTQHVRLGPLIGTNFAALSAFCLLLFVVLHLGGVSFLRLAPFVLGGVLLLAAIVGVSLGGARPIVTELRRAAGIGEAVDAAEDDQARPERSTPTPTVSPSPRRTATAAPPSTRTTRSPGPTPRAVLIAIPTRTPVADRDG